MTERLYYHDSSLLEFEARIVENGRQDRNYYTVLDRSAFYPTSGGQPFDTGQIDDTRVIDVIVGPNNEVRHISEQRIGEIGDTVRGRVDFERRQIHRQKHSAQHILSQAFMQVCEAATVSVHLGEEYAAVELEADEISKQQLAEAEQLVNHVVQKNDPIETLFVEPDEVHNIPLRRAPKQSGTLRIIKTGDFDYSACGGTHCHATGEIGLIKIIGVERLRGHTLVKFLAGLQALQDYRQRFNITAALTAQLSCHMMQLEDNVNKLVDENKEFQRQVTQLQKDLLPTQAVSLSDRSFSCGDYVVVCERSDEFSPKLINKLASKVAERIGGCALISSDNRIVVAVDEKSGLSAADIVRAFIARTDLKGGGSATLAQVGGVDPSRLGEYREVFESIINER